MSDVSVISNQYDKLVQTSDRIINSVITFQKSNMLEDQHNRQLYPKLKVSEGEVTEAKKTIRAFLNNLLELLDKDSNNTEFIPLLVLDDYKKKLSQNPYLEENIKKMLLQEDLKPDDIETLDNIIAVIENERGILFRKMRTSRG
ncbi:hypothetical protein [Mucilaginibacter sp. L3T2-6]|uniref:hypothetical protein n=1 Tax=Mucilaginibacter sp. L3T2-6 TaxID=3062491 RepID=UPI0026761DE2|nr:hypothetical protein [Mucilaginibacter sp. L3T2-6]MDO3641502.1 hypothetical protein [Mucilaginibacter sp. L3T2-6]MDV6213737.1 hypothetical protein [Mucilaginibacter sp. L3T2-6]